ncbi:hypothetical protein [uncultured Gimesia sp.]|uniref:hypothetical protein n=1 Tax=uncultured Gimesia sp. TaxID=1678688 RepID=UPI0030DDDD27|tara:strand:- start:97118 stop:97666 length:549 start_codon:yes stop_codon:yes gene_type:complete
MKRLLTLAVVMGLFYVSMSGFSSANQKAEEPKPGDAAQKKSSERDEYSDYNRDDLKTGFIRAFYDVLMDAKNDINDNEGDSGFGEYTDKDGNKHTVFDEARRTIFQADGIFAQAKADNKRALEKLRNPPRRVFPGQVQPPKAAGAKNQQVLKQQIERQEQLLKQQQQKLERLKKELVTAPVK